MDAQTAIREDIHRIRAEIERFSCEGDIKALSEIRAAVGSLLEDRYGGSSIYYTLCCAVLPFTIFFTIVLLYASAKMLSECLTRKRLWKQVCQAPIVEAELNARKLSHASRRASRRRTIFLVVIKCIVGASVLLMFVGSRLMMEMAFRSWLKGILLSTASTDPAAATDAEFAKDAWQQLYLDTMTLFSYDWFRDIQGLMIFSSIGSGVMVLGLRLLRSASDDAIALNTRSTSALYLLQKVDDRYAAKGQELMQRQISEMVSMLSECMNSQGMHPSNGIGQRKDRMQEIEQNGVMEGEEEKEQKDVEEQKDREEEGKDK